MNRTLFDQPSQVLPVIVEPGTGPFRDGLSLELRPGVNLLRAENGAGKSLLMRWIALFAKQRFQVGDLTVTDGMTGVEAQIRVGSASITCRQGAKPKAIGADTLPPIEGVPDPIALLISGNHRTGERPAFKARLGALLTWTGLQSDAELIALLIGSDPDLVRLCRQIKPGDDLTDVAEMIRKTCYELRGEAEVKAGLEQSRLDGLLGRKVEIIGPFSETELIQISPEVADAERLQSECLQALGSIRAKRAAMLAEDARRNQARATLGDRPEVAGDEERLKVANSAVLGASDALAGTRAVLAGMSLPRDLEKLVANYEDALRQAYEQWAENAETINAAWSDGYAGTPVFFQATEKNVDLAAKLLDARQRITAPREQLAAAEEERKQAHDGLTAAEWALKQAEIDRDEAKEALRQAIARRDAYDATKASLDEPLAIPEEELVTQAEESLAAATRTVEAHRAALKLREVLALIGSAEESLKAAKLRVAFYEEEPDHVWSRLAQVVNLRLKSDIIRVEGDEIQVRVEGIWRDIADKDRVSEGIRHAACYDLLLQHRRGHRVILIEDSTPVGPARLEELGRQAEAKGIILVLETPVGATAGQYEVLHYPEASS